jgi:hypothetical protein
MSLRIATEVLEWWPPSNPQCCSQLISISRLTCQGTMSQWKSRLENLIHLFLVLVPQSLCDITRMNKASCHLIGRVKLWSKLSWIRTWVLVHSLLVSLCLRTFRMFQAILLRNLSRFWIKVRSRWRFTLINQKLQLVLRLKDTFRYITKRRICYQLRLRLLK